MRRAFERPATWTANTSFISKEGERSYRKDTEYETDRCNTLELSYACERMLRKSFSGTKGMECESFKTSSYEDIQAQ